MCTADRLAPGGEKHPLYPHPNSNGVDPSGSLCDYPGLLVKSKTGFENGGRTIPIDIVALITPKTG